LLVDLFEKYIDERSYDLEEVTIKGYRASFRKFMKYLNEEVELNITAKSTNLGSVIGFIKYRQHDGIKHQTINSDLRNLRAFLYWGMDNEYIEYFKIKTLKETESEEVVKVFDEEEKAIITAKPRRKRESDFTEWRTYTIVCFVLDSGSRAASVCNIKMKDVSFEKREIYLAHTKNKDSLTVPMSSTFITILKDYINDWRKNAKRDDFLFPNTENQQLTIGALRQSLARYCTDRGVNRKSIHGLRHTFAKGYLMNNGDTFRLQKILGHSTQTMTSKYVRLFSDDLKKGFDDLSPLATSKKKSSRGKNITLNK